LTIAQERVYSLERLLRPRSVAVVGATDRDGSYGAQALISLQAIGYAGEVWGVNPGRGEVLGRPCVPSLADLPDAVDAVVVAIPAAGVPDVIEQAGALGCGGAVVFSAGFAEVPEGAGLQAQLTAAAQRHALPVCGPNCNGIVSMHARSALWGDALVPREPGAVALVSQSGNVAVNALGASRGLRFHTVIASGNQAVLSAADYLEALAGSDGLRAIALYLEDDGGPSLCDGLAACAAAGVHVVVLKVGTSAAGSRAAAAHSAALAGDQRVFRAVVEEAGAIWASDLHELLELTKTLAVPRASKAKPGLAIMTCSGGDSALGADEASVHRLTLPELSPETTARLARLLPPAATVANPLDYTAMIWGNRAALAELVQTVGEDPAVGQVLVFYDEPAAGTVDASWGVVREGIIDGAARSPVPTLVSSTLPELLDDASAWRFVQAGVPAVAGLRTGIRCASAVLSRPGDPSRLAQIAAAARSSRAVPGSSSEWLGEFESKELLRAAGVDVVAGRIVLDEADAIEALGELGGSIALKLSAVGIRHKSELGGIELGLGGAFEVRDAYRRLAPLVAEYDADLVAEAMAEPGVEVLVAAHRDGIVPALVIGLGGIWTELLDEIAIVPLPASAERIEHELRALRGAPVLTGGRGTPPVDVAAAARLAERVGELLIDAPLELIELNPVLVSPSGAVAVDASVRRSKALSQSALAPAHPPEAAHV
jgi:acetate---CoA ligase (ADP-forming)